MENKETRMRLGDKKYQRRQHDDIYDSHASEDRRHRRKRSRNRHKTSNEVSRSWSRSPGRDISRKRKLAKEESYKRSYDYMPKEKLRKFEGHTQSISKVTIETIQEDLKFVGLDNILVIHKHGKSVFRCFLCDTCTIYQNPQQLKDHVLGVNHQRAYAEEKNKSSIKIKRLSSRNEGKKSLGELVVQRLFSPNTAERIAESKEVTHDLRSSIDSKSSETTKLLHSNTRNPRHGNFLRRMMEKVQRDNQRYELKMSSRTLHPERKLSTPSSESVISKKSTPSRSTTASPSCASIVSFPSFKDTAPLDNGISSPEISSKTHCLLKLVELLSTTDVLKLLLLKLKNVEIKEEDLPFLEEVVTVTTDLSNKSKKSCSKERIDDQPSSESSPDEAINPCTSRNKRSKDSEMSPKVLEESSNTSAVKDQLVKRIPHPDDFWNSLPSSQELENRLINFSSLASSTKPDDVIVIDLT